MLPSTIFVNLDWQKLASFALHGFACDSSFLLIAAYISCAAHIDPSFKLTLVDLNQLAASRYLETKIF